MNPQTERAAAIVEQYGCKTENLIAILQDIQAAYNYLSEANLTLVADRLGISERTVEAHRSAAYRCLNVKCLEELQAFIRDMDD